jgi:hypothetical protein
LRVRLEEAAGGTVPRAPITNSCPKRPLKLPKRRERNP